MDNSMIGIQARALMSAINALVTLPVHAMLNELYFELHHITEDERDKLYAMYKSTDQDVLLWWIEIDIHKKYIIAQWIVRNYSEVN